MTQNLRELFLALKRAIGTSDELGLGADMIRIAPVAGGFMGLRNDGQVVFVKVDGGVDVEQSVRKRTALIGRLAIRYPLAMAFLPRNDGVKICEVCDGTGHDPGIPDALSNDVVCSCGGLGWRPA